MKWGVVVFPGSNCDSDCFHALHDVLKQDVTYLWHKDKDLKGVDVIVLPGGFSYGDYLRVGAMARFAPIMEDVIRFAKQGRPVMGICNGFQILVEAGLLPGALIRNKTLKFMCQDVFVKCETRGQWTKKIKKEKIMLLNYGYENGRKITSRKCDENNRYSIQLYYKIASSVQIKDKKILVTGFGGFIGSHLTEKLLNDGYVVIGIDEFNDYYDPSIKEKNIKNYLGNKKFKPYRADITDFKKLEEVFTKEALAA